MNEPGYVNDETAGSVVTRADIADAAERIAGRVRRTPVISLEAGSFGLSGRIVLKLEHLQHTGSFKARGASNRLLSAEVPEAGAVAASGGNHGAAVAYAAKASGYSAEIFVPEISSPVKVRRLRGYGAKLTIAGKNYAEALAASQERVAESGALVVHAYDQPEVVAGQGTVAREFEEQAPELDTVLVAVGGGGLIGGMAAWYAAGTRLVGVEPALAPSMRRAFEAGKPVEVEVGGIAADSLGARRVGEIGFGLARRFVDSVILADERSIREAQRLLWEVLRLVVEPAGAVALAVLLSGTYRPGPEERVGVLLCGANADLAAFGDDEAG